MALTPEDVVNKRFQPTKFREGYDQDEVDDFLDEVVVELRRLNQENEELRQRLIASDSRINELQRSGGQFAQQPQTFAQPEPVAAPAPAPVVAPAPAYAGGMDQNAMDPGNTNNLLQLARRLHEEHVREGVEKRDALIAEGHATAARVVADAEAKQRAELGNLEQERQQLQQRIDELRNFERDYRQKLKGYIEGQLRELDSSNSVGSTSAPVAAAPAPAPAEIAPQPFADAAPQFGAAPFSGGQNFDGGQSFDGAQNDSPSFDAAPPQYSSPITQPPATYPGFGQN